MVRHVGQVVPLSSRDRHQHVHVGRAFDGDPRRRGPGDTRIASRVPLGEVVARSWPHRVVPREFSAPSRELTTPEVGVIVGATVRCSARTFDVLAAPALLQLVVPGVRSRQAPSLSRLLPRIGEK